MLRGFRLINCTKDPPVVESRPWTMKYVALSYVWGRGPAEDWPRVILDAADTTRRLGFEYLWVDRLCIDQPNPAENYYPISKMASIYEGAELTIVAAAGLDAKYGLPGVGTTPRQPQPKIRLQSGSMLVSTLQDPRAQILSAEWSSRGWTYQESVLSNRKLVFTDHQVYWECRGMATQDSIYLPLHLVHER
jgi:hypothetical protein